MPNTDTSIIQSKWPFLIQCSHWCVLRSKLLRSVQLKILCIKWNEQAYCVSVSEEVSFNEATTLTWLDLKDEEIFSILQKLFVPKTLKEMKQERRRETAAFVTTKTSEKEKSLTRLGARSVGLTKLYKGCKRGESTRRNYIEEKEI